MSKGIKGHEQQEAIERIILEFKFKGLGSVKILEALKTNLGVTFSRPTIDKHYKEVLNGDILDDNINLMKQRYLLEVGEVMGEKAALKAPAADAAQLAAIDEKYSNKELTYKEKLAQMRERMIVLIDSNYRAFLDGEEPLKSEYIHYLKTLVSIENK